MVKKNRFYKSIVFHHNGYEEICILSRVERQRRHRTILHKTHIERTFVYLRLFELFALAHERYVRPDVCVYGEFVINGDILGAAGGTRSVRSLNSRNIPFATDCVWRALGVGFFTPTGRCKHPC